METTALVVETRSNSVVERVVVLGTVTVFVVSTVLVPVATCEHADEIDAASQFEIDAGVAMARLATMSRLYGNAVTVALISSVCVFYSNEVMCV